MVLGFRVWGLGLRGLGFRGLGFRGLGFGDITSSTIRNLGFKKGSSFLPNSLQFMLKETTGGEFRVYRASIRFL